MYHGRSNAVLNRVCRCGRCIRVAVELSETKGNMHGFDIVQKAPATKSAATWRLTPDRRYMVRLQMENAL